MSLELYDLVNPYTLNIFTDASMRYNTNRGGTGDCCYGAIAMNCYNELDSDCKVITDATNNNGEIKAIRSGVILAIKYKKRYSTINLFSDSQISIFGIRDRIQNWRVIDGVLYSTNTKDPIKNQDVYIEILRMIIDYDLNINFWHQSSHVNINNSNDILNAEHVFMASNGIRDRISRDFIIYISNYNNEIDRRTGSILHNYNSNDKVKDALIFNAYNFENYQEQYRFINKGAITKHDMPRNNKKFYKRKRK